MEDLLRFATTDRQREIYQAYLDAGSTREAATRLEVSASTVRAVRIRLRRRAELQGYSPKHDMQHEVPEAFHVKGVSTFYDGEGNVRGQWVKSNVKQEALLLAMQEAAESLRESIVPISPTPCDFDVDSDLLTNYVLTDAHVGALGWAEEGGDNWDLEIAKRTLLGGVCGLVSSAPRSQHAVLMQLGDFLHSDGMLPVTPTHGHVLDQDGRYPKVVRTGIYILRQSISLLLSKHAEVTVIMAQGNHDPSGSIWLSEMFSTLYENEPRVNVVVSAKPFYAVQHGRVLLGCHHGHGAKPERLPEIINAEFRDLVSSTDKTFIHCGHKHEWRLFETPTSIVEQHPTMAGRDAFASHHGFKSLRMMQCITYHKNRLEKSRCTERP